MELPVYETILNILREAGFVLQVRNEVANISGSTITTAFPNIISDTEDSAEASKASVKVYVNGTEVEISTIDAKNGVVTLESAPEEGSNVTVSYYYSPVTLDFVAITREDVECAIYQKMKGVDACAPYEQSVPFAIRMITRLWAAGLLLAREYGYNTDSEQTSKDGYRKIQEAKSMLEDLYKNGGACVDGVRVTDSQIDIYGGSGNVLAESQGDLFEHDYPRKHLSDDCYERC